MSDHDAAFASPETGDGGVATLAPPRERKAPDKGKPKQLPPYKVLLHNDDVNTFEHVIASILSLTALEFETAVERTIEAHKTGVALLLITHRERAELYMDQFTSLSITVTIEPDEVS